MRNSILGVVLGAMMLLAPLAAQAATHSDLDDSRAPYCASERHLYGKILSAQAHVLFVHAEGSAGNLSLMTSRATVRPVGMAPRAGLYFRAYGCFGETARDQNVFRATYLTLATNPRSLRHISDRPVSDTDQAASKPSHEGTSESHPAVKPGQKTVASSGAEDTQGCNGYRWATKVGADPEAGAVALSAQAVSIQQLAAMTPGAEAGAARLKPVETSVYRLTNVTLKRLYTEHDRDYHLIVTDASGRSMTLESPDPACAGGSAFLSQITAVRHYIDTNHPGAGSTLSVTGVGFYDPKGSGSVELHPLLSICAGANCMP